MNGVNFKFEDSILNFCFIKIIEFITLPDFLYMRLLKEGEKIMM